MQAIKGWKKERLTDQLKLIRNGYSGQQVSYVTEFPISRIETIADGKIDLNRVGYVDFVPNSYLLEVGDLLFSNINSLRHIGKLAQVLDGIKLFHGMNLLIFRPIEQVDANFLFYKLNSQKLWFEKMAAQAINQASINQETLRGLILELPEQIEEQTKIAEILSTLDSAIEQTEALIAKQQRIKIGLMQDLLTRGIDENGNVRSEQTHQFKDSPLGRIPVEWDVKPFRQVCEIIKDGTHLPPQRVTDGPLLLSVQNMINGKLTKTIADTRVSWDFYDQMHQTWRIKTDDVLLAIVGATIGKTCLVPVEFEPFTLQRSVAIIRGKTGVLYNRYLLQYLRSPFFQSLIHTKTNSTAQPGLYLAQIADFYIPLCSIEEQIAMNLRLEEISNLLENHQNAVAKLKQLKAALMQDLLTGKKRVTSLLEEPEEACV